MTLYNKISGGKFKDARIITINLHINNKLFLSFGTTKTLLSSKLPWEVLSKGFTRMCNG